MCGEVQKQYLHFLHGPPDQASTFQRLVKPNLWKRNSLTFSIPEHLPAMVFSWERGSPAPAAATVGCRRAAGFDTNFTETRGSEVGVIQVTSLSVAWGLDRSRGLGSGLSALRPLMEIQDCVRKWGLYESLDSMSGAFTWLWGFRGEPTAERGAEITSLEATCLIALRKTR